uniref:Uncharacterized protein n=1 Tax=Rhodnius prolixus TaxID=13249 RepID=T1IGG8_RHOPR
MGCKPSKETLRATTSADEERRSRSLTRIKQNEEIGQNIDQQQIIRLTESDIEEEEEESPLSTKCKVLDNNGFSF